MSRHLPFSPLSWLGVLLWMSLAPHNVRAQNEPTQTGSLVGRVIEATTQIPLPGANVVLERTSRGTATDAQGRFLLDRIPVGTHTVRISMVGYETVVRTGVVVTSGKPQQLLAALHPAIVEGNEVVVRADYFAQPAHSPVSVRSLHQEEIHRAPGAAEDIQRVMQAFPGVTVSDDHRNDLIVRGGSPTENLLLVDHIEVPNISHFGTQGATGGPVSMLDAEYLSEVTFLTGGFPAEYGGKLSSVLDIQLREGSRNGFASSLNMSMAGAGATTEGPLFDDPAGEARGSWFLGARRSYLDLLHGAIDLTAVPKYSGAQAKAVIDPTPRDQLTAIGLGSLDRIHFERDLESEEADADQDLKTRGITGIAGVSWRHVWSTRGYTRLTLSAVSNTYRTDLRDSVDVLDYRNRSRETDYAATVSSSWQLNPQGTLGIGGGIHVEHYRHDLFARPNEDALGQLQPGLDLRERAAPLRANAYAQYTHHVTSALALTGGLRYQYFSLMDHRHILSPRLSGRFQLTPKLAITSAWGIYRQPPSLIWFTSTPTARSLRPMRAQHYVAGVELRPYPGWRLTLEGYAKQYDYVPTFVDMPMLSTINGGTNYGAYLIDDLRDEGTAHAEGIEFFAQRRLTNVFYTTVAYSLSRARYTPLDGNERPTDHDMRHIATLVMGTKGLDTQRFGTLGGSAKLRYASGRPYTPFDLERSRTLSTGVIDADQVNVHRLPDYLRLDVRLDRQTNFSWGAITSYVEVQNVLGRRNIAERIYNRQTGEVEAFTHWGRFVVGGMLLEL